MEKWLEMMEKIEKGRKEVIRTINAWTLFDKYVVNNKFSINFPEDAKSAVLLAIKYSQIATDCDFKATMGLCDDLPANISANEFAKHFQPSHVRDLAYSLIKWHETPMRIIKGLAGKEEIDEFYAWLYENNCRNEYQEALYILIECLMKAEDLMAWTYDYERDIKEIVMNRQVTRFYKRTMSDRLKQLKPFYYPELNKDVDEIMSKYSFVDAKTSLLALTSEALNNLLTRIACHKDEFKGSMALDFSSLDKFLAKKEDGTGKADDIRRIFLNSLNKIGETDACNISFQKRGSVVAVYLNMNEDVHDYLKSLEGIDEILSLDAISQTITLFLKNLE